MRPHAVELLVMICLETDDAVLVTIEDTRGRGAWLPKSSCQFEEPIRVGRAQIITTYERLAIEKGLI